MLTSHNKIAEEFHIFNITQNTTCIAILCIFFGAIQQIRHLGRGVDEESNKNDIERGACSQKSDVPHTNYFMNFFFSITQSLFLLGFP